MVRQRSAKPLFSSSNLDAASNLFYSILSQIEFYFFASIAQLDRVSDYESEGRGFESLWAHQLKRLEINILAFFHS